METESLCKVCNHYCCTKQVKLVPEAAACFIRENCNQPAFKAYDTICPTCRVTVKRKFDEKPIVNKVFAAVGSSFWDLVTKEAINNGSTRHTNNELLLHLRFVNDQSPKNTKIRFHSTDTVAQVVKSFDKEVSLPYGIDNLVLISYTIGNLGYRCSSNNLKLTLEELKLENNSVLQFAYQHKQGSIVQSAPLVNPFQLRVKWPLRHRNMSFNYTDNTTVGELIYAIQSKFDIHASIEEMELETSYGLIEIGDLTKKLVPSSAIPIPIPVPTIFLSLKNDKIIPQNVIIHSAMDGVLSNVVTTYQSSKTDHKICIKVHCLFSNHILILVMSSKETLYDLKKYIINDHAGKGLDMKTIELGIIKPHRELDLPDKTSLADASIETETHLYADQILNKSSPSKSDSLTEKRSETTTNISQTKPSTTDEHHIKSASHSQSSPTEKKLSNKLDHSPVQLNTNNMTNQKSVNKRIVEINNLSSNLSVMTSQAKMLSPSRAHPIGLSNTGNTCFMNSALQCLAHVPPLAQYFLNLFHEKQFNINHDTNLENICDIYGETVGAFAYLMFQLWEGLNRPVYPSRMKTLVGRIAPRFMTNRQQDVQEFIIFLLDCLHCELKQNIDSKSVDRSKTIIEQLFFGTIKSCTICSVCQTKEATTNMISFLPLQLERQERFFTILYIPLLGGSEQQCISAFSTDRLENVLNNFVKQRRCQSQHRFSVSTFNSSNTYLALNTPLNEIFDYRLIVREEKNGPYFTPIPITHQSDSTPMTLMNCLEEFLACELLNGSWFCKNQCKKETESAARKVNLCTIPPVLIFQLKRFSEKNGKKHKIDKKVMFPLNGLDLSGLLVRKCSTSSAPVYDLVAVSNHIGAIFGGHYTTYTRQSIDDKWYHFDDTHVDEIQSTEVISKDAYLLFYIRRDV